jgi:hypothetical protein
VNPREETCEFEFPEEIDVLRQRTERRGYRLMRVWKILRGVGGVTVCDASPPD